MLRYLISTPPMIPLITVLFILVNGILFWKLGVSVDDDTYRFLGYAEEIRERGLFFKSHEFWYIGYVLFTIVVTAIYPSLGAIVAAQVLISYLAVISLYASAKRLFDSQWAGLWAVGLFLGFFMISFWNFWIYAESLFISMICISAYYLIKWSRGDARQEDLILGGFLILWTTLIKPTGITIGLGLGVAMLWYVFDSKLFIYYKVAIVFIFISGFIFLTNAMLKSAGFVEAFNKGEVLYNIHELKETHYATYLLIDVPEKLHLPDEKFPPLLQLALISLGNPFYASQLIVTRLFFYLLYIRPYYSVLHNLIALFFLLPVYFFGFKELFVCFLTTCEKRVVKGFLLFNILIVIQLTVDWNGRFLMPILPICFLLASGGIARANSIPYFSVSKAQ